MKTFAKLLLGAVLLGGIANAAYAQQVSPPETTAAQSQTVALNEGQGDDWHDHHGRGQDGRRMKVLDLNGDGFISADEAAAGADAAFIHLDQNNDGLINEAEFTTPRTHQHWWSAMFASSANTDAVAVLKAKKDKFATLDTDKNGTVSRAEFLADAQKRYDLADTRKDGKVSPWAFRALE